MTEITYGDWFSGFGGCSIGAKQAGCKLVFAFEHEQEIAAVYRDNLGDHVILGDILMSDSGMYHDDFPRTRNAEKRRRQDITGEWWSRLVATGVKHTEFKFHNPQFPHVTIKHDSPPCPEFSVAKKDGTEGLREIALARKCCEYLMYARPDYYTLENVYGYRNSESFQTILDTLTGLGYSYDYWHLNAADYGVPQTRKRLILIARKDGRQVVKPMPTHYNPNGKQDESGFVGSLFFRPWVGWYEAIEDLIPTLPDSQFADWQLSRLPEKLTESLCYLNPNTNTNGDGYRLSQSPATTVPATRNESTARALLVDGDASGGQPPTVSEVDQPVTTIKTGGGGRVFRAFIVNNNANDTSGAAIFAAPDSPVGTVRTPGGGRDIRAFIIDGKLSTSGNEKVLQINDQNTPSGTVVSSHAPLRPARAQVNGRVVKMTTRALARLQSFPDSFDLPGNNRLAAKGIGNAVPPLWYQRIIESINT